VVRRLLPLIAENDQQKAAVRERACGNLKEFARERRHDKAYLYITSECFIGFVGFWKDVEIKPVHPSSIHIAAIYKRLGRPSNQSHGLPVPTCMEAPPQFATVRARGSC
jgi:hypothetical protein